MRLAANVALALSIGSFGFAERKEKALCGTFPGRGALEIAKHEDRRERLDRSARPRALAAPRLEVSGDLVFITDDGGIVSEANPFDLRDGTLVFSRRGSRALAYRTRDGGTGGRSGDPIGIGDDATAPSTCRSIFHSSVGATGGCS